MTSLFWRSLSRDRSSSDQERDPSPSDYAPLGLEGLEPLEDFKDWCYGPQGPGGKARHRDVVLGHLEEDEDKEEEEGER